MNKNTFLGLNLILLAFLIAVTQLTFQPISGKPFPHWAYHSFFLLLFLINIAVYALLKQKLQAKPRQFVNTFMVASSLRMLLSLLIVILLILFAGETAKYLAVYFVLGYLLFLGLEVWFLFKHSKTTKIPADN